MQTICSSFTIKTLFHLSPNADIVVHANLTAGDMHEQSCTCCAIVCKFKFNVTIFSHIEHIHSMIDDMAIISQTVRAI